MPIYAYRCEACGFAKDVLQKISDAPLSDCPNCGKSTFKKQLTAAGFQLKGTGWYVTDFRGGSGNAGTASASAKTDSGTAASTPAPASVPASTPAPAASSGDGSKSAA
ncbi:MAG: zinc ribbon domain-containing protein [Burkholderiaceae bacterium]|nr:zinc ribbon domain-containing protein [Burkholderiaceae bacterium]